MPYFGFFVVEFKKLLSYLKSAPSTLSNCKILQNNKNAKIWDPKRHIWVILGQNFKTLFSYLKPATSNLPD